MNIELDEILNTNLYLTISTCDLEGMPWISNIYYVYDMNYNMYWYSPKDSRHSKLILKNSNVAVSIFNSTAVGDDVKAIYIQASAYEVSDTKEISKALILYGKKMIKTKFVNRKKAYLEFINSIKDFKGSSPIRLYKAVPTKIWKLGDSEIYNKKYVDRRIEIAI